MSIRRLLPAFAANVVDFIALTVIECLVHRISMDGELIELKCI